MCSELDFAKTYQFSLVQTSMLPHYLVLIGTGGGVEPVLCDRVGRGVWVVAGRQQDRRLGTV